MKKLATLPTAAEAHLLAEALCAEGLRVRVLDRSPGLTPGGDADLWLDDEGEEERARALLAELRAPAGPPPARGSRSGFLPGMLLGVALGVLAVGLGGRLFEREPERPESWDADGDGRADTWARYAPDGLFLETAHDRNADGEPDQWLEYDAAGRWSRARHDDDFDGEEDLWEEYRDGAAHAFSADNDRDGRPDEWGTLRDGQVVERRVSFANDATIDKRVHYRQGRRVREELDRDRDGRIDEVLHFDELERVVRTEAPE